MDLTIWRELGVGVADYAPYYLSIRDGQARDFAERWSALSSVLAMTMSFRMMAVMATRYQRAKGLTRGDFVVTTNELLPVSWTPR